MSEIVLQTLMNTFGDEIVDTHQFRGDATAIVKREALHRIVQWLRDDPEMDFKMLVDLTAVDYLPKKPRFEVVYHFLSIEKRHRLRLKVQLEEDDPVVESISDLYGSANWAEREAWDMYGVQFAHHPDLRRILMYEEFEGHPLRKDYPVHASQPRIDLLAEERPNTNLYRPNFGEQKENH